MTRSVGAVHMLLTGSHQARMMQDYLYDKLGSFAVGLVAEHDVLLQLVVINADALAALARIPQVEEGPVCHGKVIDSRLVLCCLAGILLAPGLTENAHRSFLDGQRFICKNSDHAPICLFEGVKASEGRWKLFAKDATAEAMRVHGLSLGARLP